MAFASVSHLSPVEYLVGLVIETWPSRIKVVRRAKTIQLVHGPQNPPVRPGDWIHFSIDENDGISCEFEVVRAVLPTEVKSTGAVWVRTIGIKADRREREMLPKSDRCIWSPHFDWVADPERVFEDARNVSPNVAYETWITVNTEPFSSEFHPIMMAVQIETIAFDQMPILDTPWAQCQEGVTGNGTCLISHSLQRRDKEKINELVVYTGVVLFREQIGRNKSRVAVWSRATGLVYARDDADRIRLGCWVDFHARLASTKDFLEVTKLRLSKNPMLPTRVYNGRTQVCEKMSLPDGIMEKDIMGENDILGLVFFDKNTVASTISGTWNEVLTKKLPMWFSYSKFEADVKWKFFTFASSEEFKVLPEQDVGDSFGDLLHL